VEVVVVKADAEGGGIAKEVQLKLGNEGRREAQCYHNREEDAGKPTPAR